MAEDKKKLKLPTSVYFWMVFFSLSIASEQQCFDTIEGYRTLFLGTKISLLAGMGWVRWGRLMLSVWKWLAFYIVSLFGAPPKDCSCQGITLWSQPGTTSSPRRRSPGLGRSSEQAGCSWGWAADNGYWVPTLWRQSVPLSERVEHCI